MSEPKPVVIKLNPSPEEYLEAETAFLRAVGACVTCWAFVDRQLFGLFRTGLHAPTHTAAMIYYGQNTIGRSLGQTDVLLSAYLADLKDEKPKAAWQQLHRRISDLLPVRNAIAHQPVKRTGKNSGGKAVYEYAIYPEPYREYSQKTIRGLGEKQELLTEDLQRHATEVQALEADLKLFRLSIRSAESRS